MDLSSVSSYSKAIAAGIAAVIVGELARYGWQPGTDVISAGGVILTAIVSYCLGHVVVWASPANKIKV